MKKSTIIYIAILVFCKDFTFAQDYNIQPKHGIEAQFGANSPVVSLKYQRYFWLNSKQHITASTGVGLFYGINFNQDITYSLGDGRNFWEVGVLGMYTSSNLEQRFNNYRYYVFPMTGYKYISPKWIYARIHFSPYIDKGELYPFAGIGIGFYFKEKKFAESNSFINTVRHKKD